MIKPFILSSKANEDLENSIHSLADEFLAKPYTFCTEADAVSRFGELLSETPSFSSHVFSIDGHQIPLVHREYPTFFRFDGKNPTKRLGPPAKRGHYDTVVLRPDVISTNPAEKITNRTLGSGPEGDPPYIFAAVEFKLDRQGWSKARKNGTITAVKKLELSKSEVENSYFVALMRYTAPSMRRWDLYWPEIQEYLGRANGVNSLIAVSWITNSGKPELYRFGNWIIP